MSCPRKRQGDTTVSWEKRLQLRQNQPLVVVGAGFAVLIGWYLYIRNLPNSFFYYYPGYDEIDSYWSLVSRTHDHIFYISLALFIISCFAFIFSFGWVTNTRYKLRGIVFGLIIIENLASLAVWCGTFFMYGTSVNHIESAEFRGRHYNLAVVMTTSEAATRHSFVLYECDMSDSGCVAQYVHPSEYADGQIPDYEHRGALITDTSGDALHLHINGKTVYTIRADEATNDVQ